MSGTIFLGPIFMSSKLHQVGNQQPHSAGHIIGQFQFTLNHFLVIVGSQKYVYVTLCMFSPRGSLNRLFPTERQLSRQCELNPNNDKGVSEFLSHDQGHDKGGYNNNLKPIQPWISQTDIAGIIGAVYFKFPIVLYVVIRFELA